MQAEAKKVYRTKLFRDLYTGIIPERFPVHDCLALEYMIQYAGKDLIPFVFQYDTDELTEVFERAMEVHFGDTFNAAPRNPAALLFKQSKVNVMSRTGMIQHPETSGFDADEYDEFIAHPYDFTLEKILPRLNPGFDKDPINRSVNFAKYTLAQLDFLQNLHTALKRIRNRYGLYAPPEGSTAIQLVPFDFLADFCRGFTKITVDIRRCPEKVEAACEALVPYLLWRSVTPVISPEGANMIMTHMAPFLRQKDFERFYWPTFYKMVHMIAERGQATYIFCESDWTRFIDYLQDLPGGTRLHMEYGDPKLFKERLGKKMILSGFYPVVLLKTGTKQQCIDKAKELIDILAPGGNFEWRFDKNALHLGDINPDSYRALMEFVLENSKYENAGEVATTVRREDTVKKFSHEYPEFTSKYIVTYDEWKKEYPPINEKADQAMRIAYKKYSDLVQPFNDIYSLYG